MRTIMTVILIYILWGICLITGMVLTYQSITTSKSHSSVVMIIGLSDISICFLALIIGQCMIN